MSRSSVASRPWSAGSSFLLAVRDAFRVAFVALLVALGILFLVVPGPSGFDGAAIAARISLALLPSFGVMAGALAVALPIALSRREARYPLGIVLCATLLGFALVLPHPESLAPLGYLRAIGPTGIFLAILAAGVVCASIAIARDALAGAVVAVGVLAIVVLALHVDVSAAIAAMLRPIAVLGDSLPALLAIVAAQMLLWLAGVHGSAMLSAVLTPVYLTLQMQNTAAFAAHESLPHLVVASIFLFVYPGGSGATLPLALLLSISRVARLRKLGRLVLLPSLTNVNEPLLFGLPVVLNPAFAVPFFCAPLVLAVVTYAAIALGFVARPAFYVPPTIPAPIATYLATLDPRAVVLVLANLAIATLIYLPFVRAYERGAAE